MAVSDIISAGLLPAAMEIIDGPTIRAVEDSVFAAGYPTDAEAALVIEFDGLEAGLDHEAERATHFCLRAGAREVRSARDEEERLALWKGRKKAFGAMGRIAPDLLVQDATVPRTTLPAILKGISEIGKRYNLIVANVFHAGDGNLHPNILFDRRDRDELERVEHASKEIMQLCVDRRRHDHRRARGRTRQEAPHAAHLRARRTRHHVGDPPRLRPGGRDEPRQGPARRDRTVAREPRSGSRERRAGRRTGAGMNNQALTPESTAETREIVLAARAAGSRLLPAGRRTWPGAGGLDAGRRQQPSRRRDWTPCTTTNPPT